MSGLRLNGLLIVLVVFLLFLQYRLWFEAGGMHDLWRLKKILDTQQQENAAIKKRNDELVFQIQRLQQDENAVEARARNELGMIKKGETFYQIVK